MTAPDLDARRESSERIADALAQAGMGRFPARLFAALIVDDDGRMTAAEAAAFLRVSPASVSGGVRQLTATGLIRREREPGSRRDVYVVDDDAWHFALLDAHRVYAAVKAAFTVARDRIEGSPGARRVELSMEFLDFMTAELDGLNRRWAEHRARLGRS